MPGDLVNNVERGHLIVSYTGLRVRQINGDAWGPWVVYGAKTGSFVIDRLSGKDGAWSHVIGEDAFKLPFGSLDQLVERKPACLNLLDPKAHTERGEAPGHLMSDTYDRMREIRRENARKGIHDDTDAVTFTTRKVCYSPDVRRPESAVCPQPTSETVTVPGDLAVQLDWKKLESLQPGLCWSRPGVEVVLKTAAPDGRKRYISCMEAGVLAAVHKKLIQYGVKDDDLSPKPPPDPAFTVEISPIEPGTPPAAARGYIVSVYIDDSLVGVVSNRANLKIRIDSVGRGSHRWRLLATTFGLDRSNRRPTTQIDRSGTISVEDGDALLVRTSEGGIGLVKK